MEITDQALASIYSSLSSCSPLVRGLAERLRRVEGMLQKIANYSTYDAQDLRDMAGDALRERPQ